MPIIIKRLELNQKADYPSLAVFVYYGNEDPVKKLDDAITQYVGDCEYYEFVDYNMDNPWARVILKEIDGFPKKEVLVEGRLFDVYTLHRDNKVKVQFLSYSEGTDARPNPIMDIALFQVAEYEGFNAYVESDLSDLWSRLIIFGSNDMPQEKFSNQKI